SSIPNDEDLSTPSAQLEYACRFDRMDLVVAALKTGLPIDTPIGYFGATSALIEAAYHGNADIVAYLLTQGASLESSTKDGLTALAFACKAGHTDIARMLLSYGANLFSACKRGGLTPAGHSLVDSRSRTWNFFVESYETFLPPRTQPTTFDTILSLRD